MTTFQATSSSHSASDLFHGDLFDDELHDLPTLLLPHPTDSYIPDLPDDLARLIEDHDHNVDHPGAQVAMAELFAFEDFLAPTPTSTNPPHVAPSAAKTEVPILPAPKPAPPSTGNNKRKAANGSSSGTSKPKKARKPKVSKAPVAPVSPSSSVISAKVVTPENKGDGKAALPLLCPALEAAVTSLVQTEQDAAKSTSAATIQQSAKAKSSAVSCNRVSPTPSVASSSTLSGPVDLSTERILALTGEHGVAESAAAVATTASRGNYNTNNSNFSKEERAQASRDRNREHARNTRLRKKAYVEDLKRALQELVAQRDRLLAQTEHDAHLDKEQRQVRFCVIQEFLNLRAQNVQDAARWQVIWEPNATLQVPNLDAASSHGQPLVLKGITQLLRDTQAFDSFLQTFRRGTGGSSEVQWEYHVDPSQMFMDGSQAVLDWTANTIGAFGGGQQEQLRSQGTLKVAFRPESNTIKWAQLWFDTGAMRAFQQHQQ